jgi:hypothetical protein
MLTESLAGELAVGIASQNQRLFNLEIFGLSEGMD